MKIRVAINGFGRIGRTAFKIAHGRSDIEVVAVNDLSDTKTLAHLLKHDSNYPSYEWAKSVAPTTNGLVVDGQGIYVFNEKDPANLPWKQLNIDAVIESTGFFTDEQSASAHIQAGAKRVVISAPIKGEGQTVVLGVNDDQIASVKSVVSNASCTTNCVAPLLSILQDSIGIKKSMMTTVHSYTASQRLQDAPHSNLREARAAAENIIPSTTGASKAVSSVLPAMAGKFDGLSVRVPTPVVSLVDLVFLAEKNTSVEEINNIFVEASKEPFYQGIVGVSSEDLVSSDYIGNSYSATVDLSLTDVVDGDLVKVVAWYDNEWGYSNRLVELTVDVGRYAWEEGRRDGRAGAAKPAQPAQQTEQTVPDPARAIQNQGQAPQQQSAQNQGDGQQGSSSKKKRKKKSRSQGGVAQNDNQSQQPAADNRAASPASAAATTPASADDQQLNDQRIDNSAGVSASTPQNADNPTQPAPAPDSRPANMNNEASQEALAEKLIQIEGEDHLN